MKVNTVTGPVEAADLGFTYSHEHVIACTPGLYQSYPELWDEEGFFEQSVEKLKEVRDKGLKTMIDLTPADFHRNPAFLRRASEASGVQIIAATGGYYHTTHFFENRAPEVLSTYYIKDINEGMSSTDVRAGIIKVATDAPGVTPVNYRILQAAAIAHRETGAPISSHTNMTHHTGLIQQDVFKGMGVDLGRVTIGHSNDTEDIPYLEKLIDRGSYIGMDRFGLDLFLSFEKRVELLIKMCDKGYADRIVLSHDANAIFDWFPAEVKASQPRWNWNHIVDDVLPAARSGGVSQEKIDQMMIRNHTKIFESATPY